MGQRNTNVKTERIFADNISTIRPPFIQPYKCKNILIKDITILNSPFWEVNPVLCENIKVTGIKVNTVLARDNYFDSTELDYPIKFKTNAERGGKLENIYVKNSTVNKSKIAVIHADFFYEEGINGNYKPILRNITLTKEYKTRKSYIKKLN